MNTRHEQRLSRRWRAAALVLLVGLVCCGLYILNGVRVRTTSSKAGFRYLQLDGEYENIAQAHAQLVVEHEALVGAYLRVESDHTGLQRKYDELLASYQALDGAHRRLTIEHQALAEDLEYGHEDYETLLARSRVQSQTAVTPPYILVEGRRVHLTFRKLDGSLVQWHVPFESLEADIQRGHEMRHGWLSRLRPSLNLRDAEGNGFAPQDFRPFIDPRPFEGVMKQLYAESADDDAFIREVWHIIGQLSTYSYEIEETPRYPLETLLAGGGDCEDTGILLTSMIRAARDDWPISLVYMDANNPEKPETVNHLIVHVDTGSRQYLIETTSNAVMEPFTNVEGWYLEVD